MIKSLKKIFYDCFAKDFDLKRKKPWRAFKEFFESIINNLDVSGIVLDAGCGNGRNMSIIGSKQNDFRIIGLDNSIELLKIIKNQKDELIRNRNSRLKTREIEIILSDLIFLPFRKEVFDHIFAIASIHHLYNKKIRSDFMLKLPNLMIENGSFILSVWRKWQKRFRKYFIKDWLKRIFFPKYRKSQYGKGLQEFGDIIIPWKKSNNKGSYTRYYHLFSEKEVKKLTKHFKIRKFSILGGPTNNDNFFIWLQKEKSEK